jgi:hypothetical protein
MRGLPEFGYCELYAVGPVVQDPVTWCSILESSTDDSQVSGTPSELMAPKFSNAPMPSFRILTPSILPPSERRRHGRPKCRAARTADRSSAGRAIASDMLQKGVGLERTSSRKKSRGGWLVFHFNAARTKVPALGRDSSRFCHLGGDDVADGFVEYWIWTLPPEITPGD